MKLTFNAFKVFINLIKSSFKFWFNQLLYVILLIGIYIDWFSKVDSQGGITFFIMIIFGYSLITTYLLKKEDGGTTN